MKIAVLGAGQMGSGIAHVCALAGDNVTVYDGAEGKAASALKVIGGNLDRQVRKGMISTDDATQAVKRITTQDGIGSWIGEADFVIEAIVENLEVKRLLYADTAPLMKGDAVLASNTSSCSITSLAKGCGLEERFIGIHFMNPVPAVRLVEIIKGVNTSQDTLDRAMGLAARLGKKTVVAEDYPGFITNRILMPLINEAAFAVHESIGTVEEIDRSARLGLGHPMGPLELADLIGLDTCVAIMRALLDGFGDPKFRPCPILVRLVAAGRLGRKSGIGFYDYANNPPVPAV